MPTSASSAASMKLLDVRLRHAGAILASALGEFTSALPDGSTGGGTGGARTAASGPHQEIACLRPGGTVDLYRIVISQPGGGKDGKDEGGDKDDEKDNEDDDDDDDEVRTTLKLITRIETRSVLRSLATVRISGSKRDVLLVGADGGCLSLIDFEVPGVGKLLHCPSFGKVGCRRDTPGQYLASDPRGRAAMIASVEKRKLVYVLHRDSSGVNGKSESGGTGGGKVVLASPLEAHRPRTVVFDAVGVDNGYDNPIFACLEVQYPELEDAVLAAREERARLAEGEEKTNGGGVGGGEVKDELMGGDADGAADKNGKPNGGTDISASPKTTSAPPRIEVGRPGDGFVKQVAYYELDLGLNHVSRRWAATAHRTACCLAAVPGGGDGPSGVLVGGEDYIEYLHEGMAPPPVPSPVVPSSVKSSESESGGRKKGAKDRVPRRIMCAVPRRELHPIDRGVLIERISVLRQKRGKFFALAQSELGDVYKITLQTSPDDKTVVTGMTVAMLDTLPVGNGLCVSKLALLFVPAEFGDHALYQFDAIDIEGTAVTCTSGETLAAFMDHDFDGDGGSSSVSGAGANSHLLLEDEEDRYYSLPSLAAKSAPTFRPTTLRNLHRVFSLDSLAPVTSVLVGELAGSETSPQLYALCGRGPRSALRILRHGLSVTELASSELPGVPGAVFSVRDDGPGGKISRGGRHRDRYIVVSFADATLVLSVGETVEEMGKESGFLTAEPTLACSALGGPGSGGGICQVYPGGVRHIQRGSVSQWHVPGIKKIECASANEFQILVALVGGELIYFELDPVSGNLTEAATRDVGADVCSLDVGPVPPGRTRSAFAAVGCRDSTVRLLSLAPGKLLEQRSSYALGDARPHSVALIHDHGGGSGGGVGGGGDVSLTVGLDDGSALRASVDPVTGAISPSPTRRFLGARPVAVSRITLEGAPAALLLSSRPWIGRGAGNKYAMAPMSYAPLDHGCSFSSEAVGEGVVATAGNTLRILSVGVGGGGAGAGAGGGGDPADDDEAFNSNRIGLRYTPRQMCLLSVRAAPAPPVPGAPPLPQQQQARKIFLAIVESDMNDYGAEEKKAMGFDGTGRIGRGSSKSKKCGEDDKNDDDDEAMDESDEEDGDGDKKEEKKDDEDEDEDEEDEEDRRARATPIRGPIPLRPGTWGSCVRLVDPADGCETLDVVETDRNEAALCCASVRFHSRGGESLLAVGTVAGLMMHPLRHRSSSVSLYRIVNGERLQLLHKTKMSDGENDRDADGGGPVLSLVHFQGRLLVGVGRTIRLYEMGKRQLLKKCELRGMPTMVKSLQAAGDRAFVGDMMQSIQFVRYNSATNRLVLMATDRVPRPVTCQELLDLNTVAVGDKFGNISVLRLPRGADAGAIDVTGTRALWDSSREDATPKLETLCNYHVGEVVTGMTRASLVAGGSESLVYVTVSGRVGALVPFASREDAEFYTSLEGHLRTEAVRYTGREPQAYRSYYAPAKHVVDGDLCRAFGSLTRDARARIAGRLEMSPDEVAKKLEDTRNALL